MNNIFLIGMMGSGKTTTARELAKLLRFQVTDIDLDIEKEARKSINQIFSEDGENVFREFERKMLAHVAESQNQVVATGGGIILSAVNVQLMKSKGTVIYLETGFPVLWERVKNSKTRPLLKADNPEQALRTIFETRTPIYEKVAHYAVLTDGKNPQQVAKEIEKLLNEKN